jgi:hypothetical protein
LEDSDLAASVEYDRGADRRWRHDAARHPMREAYAVLARIARAA